MRLLKFLVLLFFIFSTKTVLADVNKQMLKDFEWFDSLGFPDLKGKKFIKASTGNWKQVGNKPPEIIYSYCFLLEDKNGKFKTFKTDLSQEAFTKNADTTDKLESVAYSEFELEEYAKGILADLNRKKTEEDRWARFGQKLEHRAEIFVLAWACHKNSLKDLAVKLYNQASKMNTYRARRNSNKDEGSLQKKLEVDIGHSEMWRAVLNFENSNISFDEIQKGLIRIQKKFPASSHTERAKKMSQLLESMIQEEKKRKKVIITEKTPLKEKVAELIFQLRTQNGFQMSQPGACNIFLDPRKEKSPAHQLLEIGYDAVPQLIEALDDITFSRSVGYHRDFYFSHYVLRVGDCVQSILTRITGKSMYSRTYTNGYMLKDNQESEAKTIARAWWQNFQLKGEKVVLSEAVEKADYESITAAERLLKKFPDSALSPIKKALAKSKDDYVRGSLLDILSKLKTNDVTKLFLEEIKKPGLYAKIQAAYELHERKKSEALELMIKEWQSVKADDNNLDGLVSFLLHVNNKKAISALSKDLDKRSINHKVSVLSSMGNGSHSSISTGGTKTMNPQDGKVIPGTEIEKFKEKILVDALTDTEENTGISGTWAGKSYSDPRVCDIAGHVLFQLYPKKYTFDLSASTSKKDIQRITCINIWRKENSLVPLPFPKIKSFKAVPDDQLSPHLQVLQNSSDQKTITKSTNAIKAYGIHALKQMLTFSEKLPKNHQNKQLTEMLCKELALTVTEIKFKNDTSIAGKKLLERINKLKGQTLSSKLITDFVLHFTQKLPEGLNGIVLRINRSENLIGATIEVEFLKEAGKRGGSQQMWDITHRISASNENISSSGGGASLEYALEKEAYKDMAEAVNKAVASSADSPLKFYIFLQKDE